MLKRAGTLSMSAANDSARARITSAGTFRASAAAIAARVFSTWKETLPPRVKRHAVQRQEGLFLRAFGHDDRVVAHEDRLPANAAMPHDHRMIAVQGEVADPAGRIRRHGHAVRIGGVQNGRAVGRHDVDDAAFHLGQGLGRVDVVQAEMIALADVGHHGHVAAVEGQTFAEDSAAGRFEDGGLDRRVHQHRTGACGPAQSPVSMRRLSM